MAHLIGDEPSRIKKESLTTSSIQAVAPGPIYASGEVTRLRNHLRSLEQSVETTRRELIYAAITETRGNEKLAAELAGMARGKFGWWRRRMGIPRIP